MQPHQLFFMGLWLASCGYAFMRGGAPERITAGAQFGAGVLTILLSIALRPLAGAYASVEIGVALTDCALFSVITAIALTSTRFWPMLQASMTGCGLLGHAAKLLAPDIVPKAYYAVVAFWAYPQIFLLVMATWRHRARLVRYGIDHAWVSRLPRPYREGWPADEPTRPSPQS